MMKKTICIILSVLFCLALFSCSSDVYVPEKNTVIEVYNKNSKLMLTVANDIIALKSDIVVSHTSNYAIDSDDESLKEYSGLYISDTEGGYEKYENANMEKLLTEGGAKSISVKNEDGVSVVEFNCGGGGKYYRGIYYSSDDKIKNLPIPDGNLIASEEGYKYNGDEVYYYTERIAENFYYYELNT